MGRPCTTPSEGTEAGSRRFGPCVEELGDVDRVEAQHAGCRPDGWKLAPLSETPDGFDGDAEAAGDFGCGEEHEANVPKWTKLVKDTQ